MRRRDGDDQAVQRVLQERPLDEGGVVVLQRRVRREPARRHREDVDVELEGVDRDPVDRKQREDERDRDRDDRRRCAGTIPGSVRLRIMPFLLVRQPHALDEPGAEGDGHEQHEERDRRRVAGSTKR